MSVKERLRQRLVVVPKPGTEWRDAYPNESVTMWSGGEHKAGDDAGEQYQSMVFLGGLASKPKLRPHIYAVEPLCEEAADEIDRLERERDGLRTSLKATALWLRAALNADWPNDGVHWKAADECEKRAQDALRSPEEGKS